MLRIPSNAQASNLDGSFGLLDRQRECQVLTLLTDSFGHKAGSDDGLVPGNQMGQTYLAAPNADGDEPRTLRPLQVAAITYRIANG